MLTALNMSINVLFTVLFPVLFTVLFSLQTQLGCDGVRIEISPEHLMATTEDTVQISCLSDQDDDESKDVTMIELSRNDKSPIACLHHCTNITYGGEATGQFQAKGYLGEYSSESYMNVTLVNPSSEDTGIYTCTVYYLDKTGVNIETASGNLVIEKLHVSSLATALKNTITALENKNKDLEEKVTFVSAFSVVAGKEWITSSAGHTLILPEVLLKLGDGYDEQTGVFKAPRDGIYVFHVVIYMGTQKCSLNMDLVTNGRKLSSIGAYDDDRWEQTGMSSVVQLTTGDSVYVRMSDSGCALANGYYTAFNGYLVKAL